MTRDTRALSLKIDLPSQCRIRQNMLLNKQIPEATRLQDEEIGRKRGEGYILPDNM